MFSAYAYPTPDGFANRAMEPRDARRDAALGEFLLPYEAVRTSKNPALTLMKLLQSIHDAAAHTAVWDRTALGCELQKSGVPRTASG